MNKKQKKALAQIVSAIVLLIFISLLSGQVSLGIYGEFVLYMIPYLLVGYDILKKALKGIRNKQVFDENFLMAAATLGAIALGDYKEGVAVMLFYQIGELFQSYAVGKSRKNISELMDIRPDYANVEREGKLEKVDPDEVEIGSVILVGPGEKIPIDGVIIEGETTLNTSALTGESLPRDAKVNDEVISGCINMTGVIKIRTQKEFGESTVSKILDLVENSSSKKSRSENFISKFARYYTPIVCYSALALAVLPPMINLMLGRGAMFSQWIYRALTFLVISCPCALVISIPLSFFAGIGGASNQGVLVKGSNYLETLSQVKYVVFDKTGTMTQGIFEVSGIHHNEISEEKLLEYAALAESYSSHPISKSLKRAYGREIEKDRVKEVEEISGNGVTAVVDGIRVAAGNEKLMRHLGISYHECHEVGTVVHMAVDGKYAGHILISDQLKPHAKESVGALKKAGMKKTVMLTGDMKNVADKVAAELGITEVYSELLPADKVRKVEELLSQKPEKEKLAFVGDGINDAPVLSRA
ncbi:MAG: cadmium-translocating P-type ATPase, partial [Lachnospiraceae bacterium]|nr:cadmium-translocating P-type ATPase [Lachnospiraceae bacterium]